MRDKRGFAWFKVHCCNDVVPADDFYWFDLIGGVTASVALVGMAFLLGVMVLCGVSHASSALGVGVMHAGLLPLASRPKLLGSLNFASGGSDKLTGNQLGLYRFKGFILVFSATFNKAGASSFGTLASETPFTLFRDIRLNGKSLLQKCPARFMRQLNHRYNALTDASYSAPTATNTNQTIEFTLYVDAISKRTGTPDASMLDFSKNVGNPSLEVDFGSVEDLINGGDYSTKSITGATCSVYGVVDEQTVLRNAVFFDRELRFIDKAVSSTPITEYSVDLPLGRIITKILVGQYTPAPETLISTLVTSTAKVRIDVNGKPAWGPFTLQEIVRWNLQDTNGLGFSTGYFLIDFLRYSRSLQNGLDLTRVLDTRDPDRVTKAELIVDLASVANARLGVLVDSLVPPYLQKAA